MNLVLFRCWEELKEAHIPFKAVEWLDHKNKTAGGSICLQLLSGWDFFSLFFDCADGDSDRGRPGRVGGDGRRGGWFFGAGARAPPPPTRPHAVGAGLLPHRHPDERSAARRPPGAEDGGVHRMGNTHFCDSKNDLFELLIFPLGGENDICS